MNTRNILEIAPVIPVLVIDDVDTAVDLARALINGGLNVLEITLRTPQAMEAIEKIKSATDAVVGAGTVNTPEQVRQCEEAGVDFIVSPGLHLPLLDVVNASGIPYLPGIATASDALTAINSGIDTLKFFPAEQNGGIPMLKALAGPYQELCFCPTGGINQHNYGDYLALNNVACVGGSWVAPKDLIATKQWSAITQLATDAASSS